MKEITGKDLITFSKFKITSAETDMGARIRLGSMVNLLIQSATQSADNLGFGFKKLRNSNLFWVLSRLTIEIFQTLKWNDMIEIETWPKDIKGILYLRDFIVRGENRKVIAKATTGWLAIDLKTKKPKRTEGKHMEIYVSLKDKQAIKEPPEKIQDADGGDTFKVNSTYFDIDLNGHVTSTRYIDWMMDTFPIDFHINNYPKKLSVNYIKETLPGNKIIIRSKQIKEKEYYFEGVGADNSKISFRGRIEF